MLQVKKQVIAWCLSYEENKKFNSTDFEPHSFALIQQVLNGVKLLFVQYLNRNCNYEMLQHTRESAVDR